MEFEREALVDNGYDASARMGPHLLIFVAQHQVKPYYDRLELRRKFKGQGGDFSSNRNPIGHFNRR